MVAQPAGQTTEAEKSFCRRDSCQRRNPGRGRLCPRDHQRTAPLTRATQPSFKGRQHLVGACCFTETSTGLNLYRNLLYYIKMNKLLSQIIAAILGLWLATLFVRGVVIRTYPSSNFFGFSLKYQWEIIVILGIVLGLLNYFLKPVLKGLSMPLELISLGLFTIVINMALLWLLDLMFDELSVPFFLPLLYTTLIICGLNLVIRFFFVKKY